LYAEKLRQKRKNLSLRLNRDASESREGEAVGRGPLEDQSALPLDQRSVEAEPLPDL
jgi:hypothetical protein